MTKHSSRPHAAQTASAHHWRRELVELAGLFTAVLVADTVAKTVVSEHHGPVLLGAWAAALVAAAGFHLWLTRLTRSSGGPRRARPAKQEPPGSDTGATAEEAPAGEEPRTLWRMRTTVREEPGSLAALCTALATGRVDILALQTHPLGESTVDEFLLRAPAALAPRELSALVSSGGGSEVWVERADTHDLVDTPTRMLTLATRTALDAAELPLALRQLLGRCSIQSVPTTSLDGRPLDRAASDEGALEGTRLRLPDPSGGTLVVERGHLPFTPTEFARARALVTLDAQLGRRVPRGRDEVTLPEGQPLTVRRVDAGDAEGARAMHRRCSPETLRQRYHGPVADADRYLDHLLSPRYGRTLAAETASGRLVALGHLLWDGEETEVALLVEDDWQRRGIGAELLGRLVELAGEAGAESVYAVTRTSNIGMVTAMRGLGLPLDYQVEEGTLVITARLTQAAAPAGQLARRTPGADAEHT